MIGFLEAKFTDLPSQFQQTKTNQKIELQQLEFRKDFNLPNEDLVASMFQYLLSPRFTSNLSPELI
jgi:hypothetical protein